MYKQILLNGADIQLERLTKLGDPLEGINVSIDCEIFRGAIVKRIRQKDYSKGADRRLTK